MANTYLNRTFTAGNRKTYTISVWFKLATPDIPTSDYENIIAASGADHGIWIREDNKLDTYWSTNLVSTNVLRDTSAWYHVVAAVDTTQATDTNRVKIYLNGEQVSLTDASGGAAVYPTQNTDTQFNDNGGTCSIGRRASTSDHYWNGSMAHFHYIDGTAYAASAFGETDATTGIWKPIFAPSVTYGTNGFFLKFENSGAFGTDSSGNGNNFTVNGTMTQNIDTPSNVFATINPLDYSPNPATLENGNTSYNKTGTGTGNNASMTGTLGVTKGKYYYEFKPTNTSSFVAGMIRTNHDLPNSQGYYATDAGSYSITNSGKIVGGSESSVSYSYSANDIFGMAYDLDNGKFYVHVNGTYINSGDPTSGATGTGSLGNIALGSNIYVPFVSNANYDQTNLMHFNFGNGYFGTTAVASAQNPDDGIGIFEYDVPAGYRALCTKSINAEEYS